MATGFVARSPLQDAVTGLEVPYAVSVRPLAYLFAAPLFGAWDALSLLTLSQHYAVLITLVALHVSWRIRSGRSRRAREPGAVETPPQEGRGRGVARGMLREFGVAVIALAALLGFYAAGMLLPRPMTGIEVTDPELVIVDFHSHTNFSHDGWGLFTAPRNRAWHEAGGFDVAYVTDHYTWRGVDEAARDNPARAGERTVLVSGAEIRIHLRPTNILGDRARYLFALDADTVYMSPDSIAAAYRRGGPAPTLLYTMPGRLQYVVPFTEETPSGVIGIEINDGSPRGLEQVKAERADIIALADSANLALVGAANLHGWGRTVASWSILRVPGWQEMAPEEVGAAIERLLHARRRRSVEVVERRMPYHDGSPVLVALTVPWVALEHFRMLGLGERISWLVWIAAWVVLSGGSRRVGAAGRRGR